MSESKNTCEYCGNSIPESEDALLRRGHRFHSRCVGNLTRCDFCDEALSANGKCLDCKYIVPTFTCRTCQKPKSGGKVDRGMFECSDCAAKRQSELEEKQRRERQKDIDSGKICRTCGRYTEMESVTTGCCGATGNGSGYAWYRCKSCNKDTSAKWEWSD